MPTDNRNIRREFSYTRPILYKGESYPSADSMISDESGNETKGRIFADADGQYYTLGANGFPIPVIPKETLDEVTVSAPRNRESLFKNYLLESNDNTQVTNLPHREYNSNLTEAGLRGAAYHADWDRQHPNLSAWRDVATAVPFAVAAAPAVIGGGQAALGTELGQAAVGLGSKVMANPIIDAANTALGLGFAAKGAYDVSQGEFTPQTALELSGLYSAITSGKKLYDTGALWDKYTTFQGRFGNYGDNLLTNMYGTYARRYGLPDKARLPADAIRKIKNEVNIDSDGMINFTGHKGFAGNPHINTTLDRPVVSHKKGNWDGADTYLFPTKDFINQTKNGSLKSIEPSDMFENGIIFKESPEKVTVISGDVNTLNRARENGMQTLSSPRLRRMYETENDAYQKALLDRFVKVKDPKQSLGLPYATEMQRLQSMRGTPTLADFRLLEQQTGLDAGVASISEYQNAINSLNSMLHPTIQDIMNGTVKPYVYPNGREVDFIPDHIEKELNLMQKVPYNKVFYDPASHVEFNWKNSIGLE